MSWKTLSWGDCISWKTLSLPAQGTSKAVTKAGGGRGRGNLVSTGMEDWWDTLYPTFSLKCSCTLMLMICHCQNSGFIFYNIAKYPLSMLLWYYELFAGWSWLGMNLPMYMHVYIRERWVNKEISTGSKQKMGTVVNLEQVLKSNNMYCMNWVFSCCKINIVRQLECVTLRNIFSLFLLWVWLWPKRWSISPFCFSTISKITSLMCQNFLVFWVWQGLCYLPLSGRTWQLGIQNTCESSLLFSLPTVQMFSRN